MDAYMYETNFLVDFVLNKNDRGRKKIAWEKHPGRVAQVHKLAFMKKRKEEILHNKEQSTEQSSVQSTEQPSVQSTAQQTFVYAVGILAVLAIGVCLFFAYNTLQPKKLVNEK